MTLIQILTQLFIPVQSACVTVAAFVQYFLMAAFCWMLIEGVYLYLFVVKVYNINDKMKVSHGFSWGNYELKTHSLFDNLLKSKTLITMNIIIAIIILDIIII